MSKRTAVTEDGLDCGNGSKCPAVRSPGILYHTQKTVFDFVFSFVASFLLLIPLGILGLLVMIQDPGNPIYVQKRVGWKGTVLPVVKLRSMKRGADDLHHSLTLEQLEEYRREYKLTDDPRLIGYPKAGQGKFCFGSFIRKSSMDELPQIVWNILVKRNMSLVGPRPILREELEKNYTAEEQKKLLSVKPGLTGYWQAYARNKASYETGERQRMELYYVENRSLALDMKILAATVVAVFTGRGAF